MSYYPQQYPTYPQYGYNSWQTPPGWPQQPPVAQYSQAPAHYSPAAPQYPAQYSQAAVAYTPAPQYSQAAQPHDQAATQYVQAGAPPPPPGGETAPPPLPAEPGPSLQAQPASAQPPQAPPSLPAPRPVAYTSVATNKQAAAPAAASGGGWPQSLRTWVERAFSQPTTDRVGLQTELKQIIAAAQQAGQLWLKDWDNTPLPGSQNTQAAQPGKLPSKAQPSFHSAPAWTVESSPEQHSSRSRKRRSRSPSPVLLSLKKMKPGKQKKPGKSLASRHFDPDVERELAARARRFGDGSAVGATRWRKQEGQNFLSFSGSMAEDVEGSYTSAAAIRGTCQNIEKSYFRLTSKPDPSSVRPEAVLQKALDRLVNLIQSGNKKVNYFYTSDQFKGMRQDCTVQHLQNELSARIYEAHARAALENGDIGEYNQCQGQLQQHYAAGISGCQMEFLAYRIIYQAVHAGKDDRVALLTCLQAVTPEDAKHPHVQHALQVRQALALGDCTQVARLYLSAPNMARALLDVVHARVRFTGLKVLLRSHSPQMLPVSAIARLLGFSVPENLSAKNCPSPPPGASNTELKALPGCSVSQFGGRFAAEESPDHGVGACKQWLEDANAVLTVTSGATGKEAIDCKASLANLRMPQAAAAQPAGPDLNLDDFLAHAVL